jgi:hypothetical protein
METAKKRLKECRDQLARQGHAVNRDASRFSIYIVDLDPDIAPPMVNRGKLCKLVYVGQTSLTPEQRFAQHKGPAPRPGKRDLRSRIVNKRGVGLNYGLMKSLDTEAFSLEQAKERETYVSGLLERRGYRVFGDGATRYRVSRRRPQDS